MSTPADSTSAAAEPDLVITRVFAAPRELVFKVWTTPRHVMRWWGPHGFTAPFCTIDFRVGGFFHFCMCSPEGKDYWSKGVYREIVVPEKIVSTMYFSDKEGNFIEPAQYGFGPEFPSETLDIVTFAVHDGNQTKVTLQRNHPESLAIRYREVEGWSQSMDRFAEELANAGADGMKS
jgi:uncharacterized protein YndB with AHSA1/START domain